MAAPAPRAAVVWVHDAQLYAEDVVVNLDVFPHVAAGQLLSLQPCDKAAPPQPGGPTPRVVVQVSSAKPKNAQLQISVSKYVADLFNLQNRREYWVAAVEPEAVAVDFMQVSFKDQYLGRSDMWRLEKTLVGTGVYVEKKVTHAGMRAQIKRLYIGGKEVECGLVTENTKTVFRSESAKFHVFLQMSREMWEFDEDGELYIEKAVQGFLPELFDRWTALGTNHDISVILFSRLYYPFEQPSWWSRTPSPPSPAKYSTGGLQARLEQQQHQLAQQQQAQRERTWADGLAWDIHGRCFQDFYKVIADYESRTECASVLNSLKQECMRYQQQLFEQSWITGPDGRAVQASDNSAASEGNFLEATNLALNMFERVYINRDLSRTGLSVLVITPGTGLFEVDHDLLKLTKHRMIDNGIGCDVLCLSRPPLHTVPLFKSYADDKKSHFSLPHWIDISFYNRTPSDTERPYRPSRFVPSCKMYSLQMGLVECDASGIQLHPKQSKSDLFLPPLTDRDAIDWKEYDRNVFANAAASASLQQSQQLAAFKNKMSRSTPSMPREAVLAGPTEDPADAPPPTRLQRNSSTTSLASRKSIAGIAATIAATGSTAPPVAPVAPVVQPPAAASGRRQNGPRLRRTPSFDATPDDIDATMRPPSPTKGRGSAAPALARPSSPLGIAPQINSTPPSTPRASTRDRRMLHVASAGLGDSDPEDDAASVETVERDGIPIPGGHSRERSGDGPTAADGLVLSSSYSRYGSGGPPPNPYGTSPMPITAWGVDLAATRRTVIKYKTKKDRKLAINPFNPSKNPLRLSSYRRRWYHAFPVAASTVSGVELHSIKWFSLCTPACLPLTTDYFPPSDELESLYQESMYTVSLSDDRVWYKKTDLLFRELISQRLAQGFQLVVTGSGAPPLLVGSSVALPSGSALQPTPKKTTTSSALSPLKKDGSGLGGRQMPQTVLLSVGNHFHKLTLLPSTDNIELKRYSRRDKAPTQSLAYQYRMWPRNQGEYKQRNATFRHVELERYKWNYLDNMIAGQIPEYHFDESLKYWCKRFVLLPINPLPKNMKVLNFPSNERLDDEELRIAAFLKFIEVLEKSQRGSDDRRLLGVHITTVSTASYIASEAVKNTPRIEPAARRDSLGSTLKDAKGVPKLKRDATPQQVAQAMLDPETGVPLKDRRWHLRLYKKCFLGREAVDWIMAHVEGIDTRDDAVMYGNELLKKEVILHSRKMHQFLDGYFFYLISEAFATAATDRRESATSTDAAVGSNVQRWLRLGRTTTLSRSVSAASVGPASMASSSATLSTTSNTSVSAPSERPAAFELSRSLVLDVDPGKKSDRVEWAVLHADTLYNPQQCYHIQLHWLIATGRLIDELIQTWARRAQQFGLQLTEVPVLHYTTLRDDEPFRSPLQIALALPPPPTAGLHQKNEVDEVSPVFFEGALLKKFSFVLDLEADVRSQATVWTYTRAPVDREQYVHSSGAAIVQILPGGRGFVWETNRLVTAKAATSNVDALRAEVTAMCSNADELAKFWAEIGATLVDTNDENSDDDEPPLSSAATELQSSLVQPPVAGPPLSQSQPPATPVDAEPRSPINQAAADLALLHFERSVDDVTYHTFLRDAMAVEWRHIERATKQQQQQQQQ